MHLLRGWIISKLHLAYLLYSTFTFENKNNLGEGNRTACLLLQNKPKKLKKKEP